MGYRPFGSLRFVLALMVVISHSWGLSSADPHFIARIGLGNVAVMSFFVLSGFIITEALVVFYAGRPAAFIGNRLARIGPPYWAALAASVAIHAVMSRHGTAMPDGALASANVLENALAIFPRPGFLRLSETGPLYGFVRFYWAIYVEFVFYLAAFAIAAVLLLPVLRARDKWVVVAACVIAAWLHLSREYVPSLAAGLYFPGFDAFTFAPYFVAGVCTYFWVSRQSRLALLGFAVSGGLAVLHFSRYVQQKAPLSLEWASKLGAPQNLVPTARFVFVLWLIWKLASVRADKASLELDWKLGNFSYPLYLNHFAVVVFLTSLALPVSAGLQLTAIMGSLLLSWTLMNVVETPMAPLRDRLRGRPLAPSPPVVMTEVGTSPPNC